MAEMISPVSEFLQFVEASPTAFQAVAECSRLLEEKGYASLQETESWKLAPGGRYYVVRNGSALVAFSLPEEKKALHFQIVASHADSPSFKLKPNYEEVSAGHYLRLNVERYGGMIMSTWLDRPLSVAGRVVVRTENGLRTKLVNLDRDLVLIPNLPIHFNRKVNEGYRASLKTPVKSPAIMV